MHNKKSSYDPKNKKRLLTTGIKNSLWSLGVLIALTTVSLADFQSPPAPDSNQYGQHLIAEYSVPEAVIKLFNSHTNKVYDKHLSAIENALLADSEDWTTPEVNLDSQHNPYTIVISLTGKAIEDGGASALWLGGWRKEDGTVIQRPIAGMAKPDRKAGEQLLMTVSGPATTFTTDIKTTAEISLTRLVNLDIQFIDVQIWSGVPSASGLEIFSSGTALLLGTIMFFYWWVFLRR